MKFKITLLIFTLCILIYLVEIGYPGIVKEFSLSPKTITIKPWTIVTYMFLHDLTSYRHFIYNMFALVLFGIILENIIGPRRFLMLYFSSGIVAGFCGLPFYNSVIGASGAIFGILGTLAILRPRLIVLVFGVPMPMIIAAFIWALIDLLGMIGTDNIAHIGHIAGLSVGIIYGIILKPVFGEKRFRRRKILSDEEIERWEESWLKH